MLSHSTSFKDDADRWVEFDLYRTEGGSYVVARTGYSRLYHTPGCQIVRKGRHRPAQVATLVRGVGAVQPVQARRDARRPGGELIYPERPLHWAQACSNAEAAVEALAKYDVDGNRYFTHVARALIRDAAKVEQVSEMRTTSRPSPSRSEPA